jgi:hypothetical protein
MGVFGWITVWLWQLYVAALVCQHFCAFKRAGSTLKYTHVHILKPNRAGATGLGHDDETANSDQAHASVSKGGDCVTKPEDDASMALRSVGDFGTAYFHEAGAGGKCEEGFTQIKCRCGEQDVLVCYTMDHDVFQRWYDEQKWPNRRGRFVLRPTQTSHVASPQHDLACGATMVIEHYALKFVANCTGYGGAGDGDNALVREARDAVTAAYDRIRCNGPCAKSHVESFVAWRCRQDTPASGFLADAIVQWTVICA